MSGGEEEEEEAWEGGEEEPRAKLKSPISELLLLRSFSHSFVPRKWF